MDTSQKKEETISQVLQVPIEDIVPNRNQPRVNFDEEGLKELAASIKTYGIIQPLIVRRLEDKYEIIAGERRYKAAKMASLTSVPVIVDPMDERKSAEVAIVENIQRRDLSAIEEAKSYQSLIEKGNLTQEELAKKMGISQAAISNKLRLLTLSNEVQDALMDGKISERHARSLLQLKTKEEQNAWLNIVINDRITVKELDRRLKEREHAINNINPSKVEVVKQEVVEPEKDDNNMKDIDNVINTAEQEIIPPETVMPNIEDIKERATDIVAPNEIDNSVNSNQTVSSIDKPMPNKFFNFLEYESVNMNVDDNKNNNTEEKEEKENTPEEEIELLDFIAPVQEASKKEENTPKEEGSNIETPKEDVQEEIEENVMQNALTLMEELEQNLKLLNYQVKIEHQDNNKELKYKITISKN